jgi:hypothetical protein
MTELELLELIQADTERLVFLGAACVLGLALLNGFQLLRLVFHALDRRGFF